MRARPKKPQGASFEGTVTSRWNSPVQLDRNHQDALRPNNYSELVVVSRGTTLAKSLYQYLGELLTPNTKPTDVNFFKIYEKGYDAQKGRDVN
jgi:hypothetical protein